MSRQKLWRKFAGAFAIGAVSISGAAFGNIAVADDTALNITNSITSNGDSFTYSYEVSCATADATDYVGGWIDWNLDGTFNTDVEQATAQCSGGKATLTWDVPAGKVEPWIQRTADVPPGTHPTSPNSSMRLRTSSNPDDITPYGSEGVVEDRPITWDADVTVSTDAEWEDGKDPIPGTKVTWTVSIRNRNGMPFSNEFPIGFNDDLSDVLNHVDPDTLTIVDDAGGTATIDIEGKKLSWLGVVDGKETVDVQFSAVIAKYDDGKIVNRVASKQTPNKFAQITVLMPHMQFTKTADPSGTVRKGGVIHYSITITNDGEGTFEHSSAVDDMSDVLDDATIQNMRIASGFSDATLSLNGTNLVFKVHDGAQMEPSMSSVIEYEVKVNGDGDGSISNKVCPSVLWADKGENDCATTSTKINYPPEIELTKTADQTNLAEAKAGDKVTYTFTVKNIGRVEVKNLEVSDPRVGGNVTLAKTTLAPGESTTGTAEYTLTQADIDAGEVLNTATATGEDEDGETTEDTDDETVTITQKPAIELVKSADRGVIEDGKAGDKVTYTFTVTNTGNVTLSDVKVDDPKLGGAITLAKTTLAPGESTTGTAEYTLTQADVDAGKVDNVATTEGTDPNDEKVTDEDDETVTITQPAPGPGDDPTPGNDPTSSGDSNNPTPTARTPISNPLVKTGSSVGMGIVCAMVLMGAGVLMLRRRANQ